jgi:hypothetical protein
MIAIIKNYFSLFLSLLFNLWLIVSNEKVFLDNLIYSSTLVLLDNKIVDVTQNGIHFFDEQFQTEEENHFIEFSENLNGYDDLPKISMSQFSQDYEGYILILCKKILYIFNKNHTLINNISLDDLIKDNNNIIAYKKENNYLHYIITSMITYYNYYIIHFKYNLNSNVIENTIEDQIANNISAFKFQCLFMTPLSFPSKNYDFLNCFYISSGYPFQLYTSSFDPEQRFNEIESLRYNMTFDCFNADPLFFGVITNEEKDKTLFYSVHNNHACWTTFNYINNFTNFDKMNDKPFFIPVVDINCYTLRILKSLF